MQVNVRVFACEYMYVCLLFVASMAGSLRKRRFISFRECSRVVSGDLV